MNQKQIKSVQGRECREQTCITGRVLNRFGHYGLELYGMLLPVTDYSGRDFQFGQGRMSVRGEDSFGIEFLYCPGLDATNNLVERVMHILVVSQKNRSGNQAANGAQVGSHQCFVHRSRIKMLFELPRIAFEEPATGPPTGSLWADRRAVNAGRGRMDLEHQSTAKAIKISTSIPWFAMSGSSNAAIPPGKQIPVAFHLDS